MDEQKEISDRIYRLKVEENKKELKKIQQEKDDRVKAYFKERVEGKTNHGDIFWSIKDDFFKYADKKGGLTLKLAKFAKARVQVIEERMKKEAEEAEKLKSEEDSPSEKPSDDQPAEDSSDLEIPLEEPEEAKIEVSQEVLDSIFGKEDDNEEDIESEQQKDEL